MADHSGDSDSVGEDRLAAQLKDDPGRQALFANGVEIATRTGLEAKRRLLARVVVAAILDDDALDEAHLRVEALRDLDIPQIRALERLKRLSDDHAEKDEAYHMAVQHAWKAEAHPIRAALTRTGMAFEPSRRDTYGFAVDGITFSRNSTTSMPSTGTERGSPPPEQPV